MSIYLSTTLTIHLLTIAYALISSAAEKSIDINAFEAMMARSYGDLSSVQSNSKISMGTETFAHRSLELSEGQCWSTRDDRKPNRYCIFDDTPREGAFLSLSCPTSRDDLTQCGCTIGIGDSEDAPNTGTCWKCGFCRDGSLAYDCRNVAEGTCIGRYDSLALAAFQDEFSNKISLSPCFFCVYFIAGIA
jgi:hypothetical protein